MSISIPTRAVPALPLRATVLFPGVTASFAVGRPRSLALVRSIFPGDLVVAIVQKDPRAEDPGVAEMHAVGTLARVREVKRRSDTDYALVLEGLRRVTVDALQNAPNGAWQAQLASFEDTEPASASAEDAQRLHAAIQAMPALPAPILNAVEAVVGTPDELADLVASALFAVGGSERGGTDEDFSAAVALLQERSLKRRLGVLTDRILSAKAREEVRAKIDRDVRKELGKHQREAVLREQLKAIRKELGEGDADAGDKLEARLGELDLPADVRTAVDRELAKLRDGAQGPEGNVLRNWLEFVADLPWNARATGSENALNEIEARLNADHEGLDDVKKRILEHMAVLQLRGATATRAPLLCLVGPPGVGKTSLGQSIADATGRPFVRVALGGVRDEADIRGHRRTYVGALPGRILGALRKAKVRNPVVLLDEIDKLEKGWMGSPEAALLEVLDPEQNKTFTDHYLDLPFDLSEVLFVCTANQIENLSGPLRDRLEVVELAGYTVAEKVHIARKHLLPKRATELGIDLAKVTVTDDTLTILVRDYTREAGVRQLDREIGKLLRGVALALARSGATETVALGEAELRARLGKSRFEDEVREAVAIPGVATGLAWTPVGGSILFVETSRMPGRGGVEITGQLGEVMRESARAAFTYVRSHAAALGIDAQNLDGQDVHIHVPQGAIPKDGPSAGVTIFTALTSLFTGRAVRADVAMTGECTLRGRVLPVGGIKAKVLAAHRAGMKTVILPKRCERDLDDVPENVRNELRFVFVSDMQEVLDAALEPFPAVAGNTAASGATATFSG